MARMMSISDLLHEARMRRRVSVTELAATVGVSPAAVYGWEAGRNRPTDSNLKAVCRVLKLPIRATLNVEKL